MKLIVIAAIALTFAAALRMKDDRGIFEKIGDTIKEGAEDVKETFESVGDKIVGGYDRVIGRERHPEAKDAIDKASDALKKGADYIPTAQDVKKGMGKVVDTIKEGYDRFVGIDVKDTIDSTRDLLKEGVDYIPDTQDAKAAWHKTRDTAKEGGEYLRESGERFVDEADRVTDKGIFEKISDTVKDKLTPSSMASDKISSLKDEIGLKSKRLSTMSLDNADKEIELNAYKRQIQHYLAELDLKRHEIDRMRYHLLERLEGDVETEFQPSLLKSLLFGLIPLAALMLLWRTGTNNRRTWTNTFNRLYSYVPNQVKNFFRTQKRDFKEEKTVHERRERREHFEEKPKDRTIVVEQTPPVLVEKTVTVEKKPEVPVREHLGKPEHLTKTEHVSKTEHLSKQAPKVIDIKDQPFTSRLQ